MAIKYNSTEKAVLTILSESPGQTAKSIAGIIGLSENHIGILLKVLTGDLLERHKVGRSFVYSLIKNRGSLAEINYGGSVILEAARALARHLHANQLDKQGRPYFEHVQRVANECSSLSIEQHVAAYLHDVLEDTDADSGRYIDYYAILSIFGEGVAKLVRSLTRLPGQTYHQYIVSVADNPLAIPIKLADLNDNLDESRGPIPESLRKRYLRARDYLTASLDKRGDLDPSAAV